MFANFSKFNRILVQGCAIGCIALTNTAFAQDKNSTKGLYLWGDNSQGLISANGASAVKLPVEVPFFRTRTVKSLAVSPSLGVAALSSGDVVQWTSPDDQKIVLKGKGIKQLLVTPKSSNVLALSKSGSVYLWDKVAEPQEVPINGKLNWFEKIVDIKCGVDHVVALTNQGNVYSGFVNPLTTDLSDMEQYGQLGIAAFPYFDKFEPWDVNKLFKVKLLEKKTVQIACGFFHTLFLLENNELWGSGSNGHGQLLLPFTFKNLKSTVPRKIAEEVSAVYAGSDLTVFKHITNGWMVAGDGQYGQFGTGALTNCQVSPLKMPKLGGNVEYNEELKKSVELEVSRYSIGSSHVFAEMNSVNKDWLAWGSSNTGQLGTNKLSKMINPTPVAVYMDQIAQTENLNYFAGDGVSACYYS